MGMSDQYDDGRYDGGGIEYLQPKEITMPGKITTTNSEALSIAAAAKRIAGEQLIKEANELEKRATVLRRPEPRRSGPERWAITVHFQHGGKAYEYLIKRSAGKYFTTGTGSTSVFDSWAALLKWLDEETVSHSQMYALRPDFNFSPALNSKEG